MQRFVACLAVWTLIAPAVAIAGEIEDAKRIPTSITMRLGDFRRYKNVGMAAISDKQMVKIRVEDKILSLKAMKIGLCFLWVFPPKGGPSDGSEVKAGLKKQITVRVTP